MSRVSSDAALATSSPACAGSREWVVKHDPGRHEVPQRNGSCRPSQVASFPYLVPLGDSDVDRVDD